MKKNLIICALAALIILYTVVFGTARKPVNLVCDIWPPYQIKEKHGVSGFSTELIQAVYASMGISIEDITAYPWKRALSIFEQGHADALYSATFSADRTVFAHYPKEVLFDTPWIIWSQHSANIQSMEDLKGKRIGVVLGYAYTKEFWDFIETHCSVEQVSSDEINFKKLEFGRIDAVVAEFGNGHYLVKKFGLRSVKPVPQIELKWDGLFILFNRENVSEKFVQDFSKHLKKYKKSDSYKALRERYFSLDAGSR